MLSTIEEYSELKTTQITWVDRIGVRCIADLCYRSKPIGERVAEIVCVVTERADNPGMSITNSVDQVAAAIISRFGAADRVMVTERYDSRSYSGNHTDSVEASYAQFVSLGGCIQFRPVHPKIREFFEAFWNDRERM